MARLDPLNQLWHARGYRAAVSCPIAYWQLNDGPWLQAFTGHGKSGTASVTCTEDTEAQDRKNSRERHQPLRTPGWRERKKPTSSKRNMPSAQNVVRGAWALYLTKLRGALVLTYHLKE